MSGRQNHVTNNECVFVLNGRLPRFFPVLLVLHVTQDMATSQAMVRNQSPFCANKTGKAVMLQNRDSGHDLD